MGEQGWDRPSPRVAELIRTGVEQLLGEADALFDEVDTATLAAADPAVTADPALVAAVRRTNRNHLAHWAEANIRAPGERVEPNLSPETLGIARDLVRRGLDYRGLDGFRVGQNIAWRMWMARALTLT